MTDTQDGWSDGWEIVLDGFRGVAWQKGLREERAAAVRTLSEFNDDCGVVRRFCTMLDGGRLPLSPFATALSDAGTWEDAQQVILDAFRDFVLRERINMARSCDEIAHEMTELVKFQGKERSQNYKNAIAHVVRPFCRVLKERSGDGSIAAGCSSSSA